MNDKVNPIPLPGSRYHITEEMGPDAVMFNRDDKWYMIAPDVAIILELERIANALEEKNRSADIPWHPLTLRKDPDE